MDINLKIVNSENIHDVLDLKVKQSQEQFVASNPISLAEAYVYEQAWPRAIYRDKEAVGFLMLSDALLMNDVPPSPSVVLLRFMIDKRFQSQGIGKIALDKIVEHVQAKGYKELYVSSVPGDGSPDLFYQKYGFEPTGKMLGDEAEMLLKF